MGEEGGSNKSALIIKYLNFIIHDSPDWKQQSKASKC